MKVALELAYARLLKKYNFAESAGYQNIHLNIRRYLREFTQKYNNVAIWCYGSHTKMLMADFMNELKNVHYIVDQSHAVLNSEGGFEFISKKQILEKKIDAIIISSYKYKDAISKEIRDTLPDIAYLDLYVKLENDNISLKGEYFAQTHPYMKYININQLQITYKEAVSLEERHILLKQIIEQYIHIKDFLNAIRYAEKLIEFSSDSYYIALKKDLEDLYALEQEGIKKISENNVVLLCMDGVRRRDLQEGLMPNFCKWSEINCCIFENAYSVSTSTYESLIPAYSENNDMRTQYFFQNEVAESDCRFISEAIRQKRNIFFYTDTDKFINSDHIHRSDTFQTVTEKIWNFVLDAEKENNGLFYIHILYETHYSYPNPYSSTKIIAEGSNVMFDYLEVNGGKIRTNYIQQHMDALKYIDEVLTPMLECLKCRMVIYADHGNILLDEDTALNDIPESKFTYDDELIEIPLLIKSPDILPEKKPELISLMEINEIIISLLNKRNYIAPNKDFVKVQRSAIYNPDFIFLYKKAGYEYALQAFETFIFKNDLKFNIFSNGVFKTENTSSELNNDLIKQLFKQIKNYITVCHINCIKL